MKIRAIITLYANGKEIAPGTVVEITDGEAQRLIERGFAAENKTERTPSLKASKPSVEKKSESAPALEDIIEAIACLDGEKDFSNGEKPSSEALGALLGAPVTTAQRDHAFEIFLLGKEEGSYDE